MHGLELPFIVRDGWPVLAAELVAIAWEAGGDPAEDLVWELAAATPPLLVVDLSTGAVLPGASTAEVVSSFRNDVHDGLRRALTSSSGSWWFISDYTAEVAIFAAHPALLAQTFGQAWRQRLRALGEWIPATVLSPDGRAMFKSLGDRYGLPTDVDRSAEEEQRQHYHAAIAQAMSSMDLRYMPYATAQLLVQIVARLKPDNEPLSIWITELRSLIALWDDPQADRPRLERVIRQVIASVSTQ